jgi:hypothetical protein
LWLAFQEAFTPAGKSNEHAASLTQLQLLALFGSAALTRNVRCLGKIRSRFSEQSGPLLTRSGHAPADTLDGFGAIRNSGLRISLRNYKVPNGKLNVTVGKRSPILNSCQRPFLEDCWIFREERDQTTA